MTPRTLFRPTFPTAMARWSALAVVACLPLAGCGTIGAVANTLSSSLANAFSAPPAPGFLDVDGLTMTVDAEANGRSAFAVDLVYVKDLKTLDMLKATPASKWFATRADLQRTYPDAIVVRGWELVPRQVLRLDRDALGSPRVAGVLVFADYRSPGEHRASLPDLRDGAIVRFGPAAFDVVPRHR